MATELEYIQDAYTNKSYRVVSAKSAPRSEKKEVKFDSEIYLDELFKKAFTYAQNQGKRIDKSLSNNAKLYVSIDIVSYGASNAKMGFVARNKATDKVTIDLVDNHIGNLRLLPSYNAKDIEFIEEFQLVIKATFQCFGKRWYELSEYDVKHLRSNMFSLVEINQYPHIYFDNTRYFRIETIVCKFFQTMLRCFGADVFQNENKLKKVCVSIPSDFHTYQRFILKHCLDHIGLSNFIITAKSTALAMPFLARDRLDSSKKLIIDFGSGYLNCLILQLTDQENVRVLDQLADQKISSKKFFDTCFRSIKKKIQNNTTDKIINSQLRNNLYKIMNANRHNEPQYSKSKKIREHWRLKSNGATFDLNMTELGARRLAESVIEKFNMTHLINRDTRLIEKEIKDILICSDNVLFEYLEPMLYEYLHKGTNIIFMDLDCACLGGSFMASTNITLSEMLAFPIGMSMYNGVVKNLIEAKRNFPCTGQYLFQTIVDNQEIIRINLYEGFSTLARSNKHICEIKLDQLSKNPFGAARNKLELFVTLDVNGLLDAYAEEIDTKERLELDIDYDSVSYLAFERDPAEKPVNINKKIQGARLELEYNMTKFLDDLDCYLEYLIAVYKYSPDELRQFIQNKILQAKKYLSKNRLKICLDECHQLASELEEIVETHKPYDENMQLMQLDEKSFKPSGVCNIL